MAKRTNITFRLTVHQPDRQTFLSFPYHAHIFNASNVGSRECSEASRMNNATLPSSPRWAKDQVTGEGELVKGDFLAFHYPGLRAHKPDS